ncbi:MAG: methyltransferase domain-containing protein [Vitreoscilla sp.]
MNLFDLINRNDVSVEAAGGAVSAERVSTPTGQQRAVMMAPGASLRIRNAHELTSLALLPADLGWSLFVEPGSSAVLNVQIELPGRKAVDVPFKLSNRSGSLQQIRFDWPGEMTLADEFHLHLSASGGAPLRIIVGPLIDMKAKILHLARGRGVEVGPGLNPMVLPSADVDVVYIEAMDSDEWITHYAKSGDKPMPVPKEILARYVKASAVTLDGHAPDSLDFIFSNHVFEHLQNPIQVLTNWLVPLKPGGLVLAVIPDPRYTFDARQPLTTVHDALREEAAGGYEIPFEKYERWCRYTEPRRTPASLIETNYSIHVNFFTPQGLQLLAELLKARGLIDHVYLTTATNHKDCAFLLRKSGGPKTSGSYRGTLQR